VDLQKCPVCSRIALLLTGSGIANFKKGGQCHLAKCQNCGYESIT
jgi:hypothetical protein